MISENLQPYLDIAIDILETKDISAIKKLKSFLTVLPVPRQIELILATAILHAAEYEPTVLAWAVENQAAFAPELELFSFTKKQVLARLNDRGWIYHRDFELNDRSRVILNRRPGTELHDCFSHGEWRLIESIFKVDTLR